MVSYLVVILVSLFEPQTQLPSDPLTQLVTDLLLCSNAIVSGVARMWKLYRHSMHMVWGVCSASSQTHKLSVDRPELGYDEP